MQLQFDSIADLWAMNGHGVYVWLAYAITLVVLIYLVVSPVMQRRQFFKQQLKLQRLSEKNSIQ